MRSALVPVLVFTRTPVPGRVKTRLIPAIGAERAARLHCAMLRRTVSIATKSGVGPVSLWCTPCERHPFVQELGRDFELGLFRQRGQDLGERMHAAIASQSRYAGGAILVGSDCPCIEVQDFRQAAEGLREGLDAVIGPASDGGYFLIALRRADETAFTGVTWGGDSVLASTCENMERLGWRYRRLGERRDVDRPEDLRHLSELWVY